MHTKSVKASQGKEERAFLISGRVIHANKGREEYIMEKDQSWQSREAQDISGAASSVCVLVET